MLQSTSTYTVFGSRTAVAACTNRSAKVLGSQSTDVSNTSTAVVGQLSLPFRVLVLQSTKVTSIRVYKVLMSLTVGY